MPLFGGCCLQALQTFADSPARVSVQNSATCVRHGCWVVALCRSHSAPLLVCHLQLQEQLEAALRDAEEALAGLQPEAAEAAQQQQQQAAGPEPPAAAALEQPTVAAAAGPAAHPLAAAQPRRAAPGSSNARIHPRSKYAYEEPDFAALAQLYPSLAPFLLRPAGGSGGGAAGAAAEAAGGDAEVTEEGGPAAAASAPGRVPAGAQYRASIDFTSPAACRELTRVLLRHDFGIEWCAWLVQMC